MSARVEIRPLPSDRRSRFRLLDIFMPVVLTLFVLFFAIEIGLRIFYWLIPLDVCAADELIGTYVCQPYFVYDNPIQIGYHYRPGFRLDGLWDPANPHLADAANETMPTGRSDAFEYHFQTDEMGFPNNEYEWRDRYDVVIAGDSFTIRTAPRTWIESLSEKGSYSILTLGAPSWSTLNEAQAIQLYGLDKQPQWVLLMFFEGNDVLGAGQYLERYESGLNWKEYDLQQATWSRRLLTPHLVHFFAEQLLPSPQESTSHYRYPVTASTEAGPIQTVLKDIHLLPMSANYDILAESAEFAAVKESLLELHQLVIGQGSRFLVVYIPSKEHVLWSRIWDATDVNHILERTVTVTLDEEGFLQWQRQYLSFEVFNDHHADQERLLEDFTRTNGIEFLNLTPIFWQTSIQQGELYHYADPHWNQAGNELAAEMIYAYMQQR